jgi:hypothetical protein
MVDPHPGRLVLDPTALDVVGPRARTRTMSGMGTAGSVLGCLSLYSAIHWASVRAMGLR